MIGIKMREHRTKAPGAGGRAGLWMLVVTAMGLVAVMGLMMASADQTPYGATQVWSAEPTAEINPETTSLFASHVIGGDPYGQDVGSLPAATYIHFGAR